MREPTPIGIVGTGFIARGLGRLVMNHHPDLRIVAALTRRRIDAIDAIDDFPLPEVITNSLNELIDKSRLIVECSGDPIHATVVIEAALAAGKPVVTMNSELHVTTGSWFVGKGLLTEAEGDQPGCLAALREDILQMGFKPLVYGNMKGFLNHNPEREEMQYWADRQGFSLDQTTSFTDGTKLQIEQAFIANGMGATIARQGMIGPANDDTEAAAKELAEIASGMTQPIADYVVSRGQAPGVFIAASHDEAERIALRNIKMGDGPYYVLQRNYHLCAIEIVKTIRRVLGGGGVLLDNSAAPEISVAAIAKTALRTGQTIRRGIGGFEVRGEAVRFSDAAGHVPIGILQNAVLRRPIEPGQMLRWEDVELPDSRALDIVHSLQQTAEHSHEDQVMIA